MSYTFRVVFSGPCAYVPNIVKGDDPGSAKSWSVILPDLHKGWTGDDDKVQADRHLAALLYSPHDFDSDTNPDAILLVKDSYEVYQHSSLFFLTGHRITFDLPDAAGLTIEDVPLDPRTRGDQAKVLELLTKNPPDPLLRSMDWLPAMSWLQQSFEWEWFGYNNPDYYFRDHGLPDDGYPVTGVLAAHVLLKQGTLIANEIDVRPKSTGGILPIIWEFMPLGGSTGSGFQNQALAKSIALEVTMPDDKAASITLSYSPDITTTLTLKNLSGTRSIEIKNRELEEIFLPGRYEYEPQQIDLDFRYLYSHASLYDPKYLRYPLPHLLYGTGAGNETGTCGGNRFSGFATGFGAVIGNW